MAEIGVPEGYKWLDKEDVWFTPMSQPLYAPPKWQSAVNAYHVHP